MKSQLDILHWTKWCLEEFNYFDFELEFVLAECKPSPETEKNTPVPGAHSGRVRPGSRRYRVFFDRVLVFQIVAESHLKPNQKEKNTEDVIQKLDTSALLDYVERTYEFGSHDKYNHYRIKTTNEVVEAISAEKPIISEIRP